MLKYSIFTIFLILSQAFGLLETLFHNQNDCYSKCDIKNGATVFTANACKKGCDYKLHNGDCANKCKLFSTDQRIQASCLSSCSPNNFQPLIPIDNQALRSIILIRLRQRPSVESTSINLNSIPVFMNIKSQLNENKNWFKPKNPIPSFTFNNEETRQVESFADYDRDQVKPVDNQPKQYINTATNQWSDLFREQSTITTWICFIIILLSCVFLLYMIVSIYRYIPMLNNCSNRLRKLAVDNIYEKPELPSDKKPIDYENSMLIKY